MLNKIKDAIGVKPYYEEPAGVIYNADCLDILPMIPEKSINLALTDPPYGIGIANSKNLTRGKQRGGLKNRAWGYNIDYGEYGWDQSKASDKHIENIITVSVNQIIFGGNYYAQLLGNSSCWIVWDKDNGENDFSDCELAWTSFGTAVRKFKWRWHGMLQEYMSNKEHRTHPSQKPLPLFKWILEKYSQPDNLILDPFLGSGTTAVAAKQLGRQYIGIEISQKYCDIAIQRLAQEVLI